MAKRKRNDDEGRVTEFTELGVGKLKPPPEGQVDWFEKLQRGRRLVLRLSYGGTKAWRVAWYDDNGKLRTKTLGRYPDMGVAAARKAAFDLDPKKTEASAEAGTFKQVAEDYFKRHVLENGLRSQGEIRRMLERYLYPHWSKKPLYEINRKMVNQLLDEVADNHGKVQADAVLAVVRGLMNWYQTRDDSYTSPIVKGMRRDKRRPDQRQRKRILNDDEIRVVWKAAEAEEAGTFGALVRVLLITGQRKSKVQNMKWSDVETETGVWTIATEAREKGNAERLKLPTLALEIIEGQDVIVDNPFVFPGRHARRLKPGEERARPVPFNSFSERKAEFDAKLNIEPWTIHDLRRTARSLLSRAGVDRDIRERVIGHAIAGVEGIYDRHSYFDEKADALQKLADLLALILNPPDKSNVADLAAARAALAS